MTVTFLADIISSLGILLVIFYICGKAIHHRATAVQKFLSIVWCFLWAALFSLDLPTWIMGILFCGTSIVLIRLLIKATFDTVISAFLLAYGVSYVCYSISALVVGLAFSPFLSSDTYYNSLVDFNHPVYLFFYAVIAAVQFFIAYRFFKIRRFKLGLPFLSGRYIVAVALVIAGIVLAIITLVGNLREDYAAYQFGLPLAFSGLIVGIGIYIWIRRRIKMWQRKRAWERNEELYLQEKAELTRELEHYKSMHEDVRTANHKMMHRQAAAERGILRMIEIARKSNLSTEFSEELTMMMDDVRKLSHEYQETVGSGNSPKKLPSTNIRAIDELFTLFAERFAREGIDFNLKVNGSIVYMTENVIPQGKLETMIGDHLQDALNAVMASGGNVRGVLAMLGDANGCYEFSVQDSGIPFEADTLIRLGTERVTTRADTGGTGTGFMTTFETMRECRASLIITENAPGSSFSKTVAIRFDGRSQYIIDTYRPGDFPESDRYSVIGNPAIVAHSDN